jgi:hypothetical protein
MKNHIHTLLTTYNRGPLEQWLVNTGAQENPRSYGMRGFITVYRQLPTGTCFEPVQFNTLTELLHNFVILAVKEEHFLRGKHVSKSN